MLDSVVQLDNVQLFIRNGKIQLVYLFQLLFSVVDDPKVFHLLSNHSIGDTVFFLLLNRNPKQQLLLNIQVNKSCTIHLQCDLLLVITSDITFNIGSISKKIQIIKYEKKTFRTKKAKFSSFFLVTENLSCQLVSFG